MRKGFTLIELSIVLIIIGLIVGGVLVGQNLIEAAKLRKLTSQINSYNAAINSFVLKYGQLPGDITYATGIWGTQVGACISTPATTTATCNGDGDKGIDYDNTVNTPHEAFRAWQHLTNAELIEGQYTGAQSGGAVFYKAGVNFPESGLGDQTTVSIYALSPTFGWSPSKSGTYWAVGKPQNGDGRWHYPALEVLEMIALEKKYDDNMPYQGVIQNMRHALASGCSDTLTVATAVYDVTATGIQCVLFWQADIGQ